MFLRCNETFLTSFAIDDLLNKLVAEVCEKRPVSSRQVLELMRESLETQKLQQWYYTETVRSFNETVHSRSRRGFPLQMTCPLYFRIPQEDGGVHELFRYGSEIAVTPNNYDCFELMLRSYQAVVNQELSQEGYYEGVRCVLPISAHRNLLNSSYTPIINFLQECLLNPASPWAIRSSSVWDELMVTYAVPFAGRLFAVDPTKPVTALVPFEEANRFVELASERCRTLNSILKTGASLNVARKMATAFAASTAPRTSHPLPPATPPVVDRIPPKSAPATIHVTSSSAPSDDSRLWDAFAGIGLRRENFRDMIPAEVEFWKYILRLQQSPSQVFDISFHLEFGPHHVDLKENGRFIPVTRLNLDQFIEAVVARQDEVHTYINEVASGTPTHSSTSRAVGGPGDEAVPVPSSAPTGVAATAPTTTNVAATHPMPSPQVKPKVPLKPSPRTATAAEPHSSAAHLDGDVPRVGELRLTARDLDTAVMRSILELRTQMHNGRLTKTELSTRQLRFCLPCHGGVCNLIPNGRHIQVATGNVALFLQYVEEEKRRIEAQSGGSGSGSGVEDDARGTAAPTAGRAPATASAVTTMQRSRRRRNGSADAPQAEEDENFWRDCNVLEIWTYECATDCLLKSSMSPEEIVQQTQLQWDTKFVSIRDCPYPNATEGRCAILPKDVKTYLRMLRRRLQAIRLAILDAGQCPRQPSAMESVEWEEEDDEAPQVSQGVVSAVPADVRLPLPPTQEELNMFSPTHNTGLLLAPPQSLNL